MREDFESWLKLRGYLHFDNKVSSSFAISYVKDADNITSHSFMPFLTYTKTLPRYKSEERKVKLKERKIMYAGHLDSHIYAWYAHQLSQLYEVEIQAQNLSDSILAYRSLERKNNIHFANEIFDEIEKRTPCNVYAFDISGFFDNIDHTKLKDAWCKVLGVSKLPLDHYKVYRSITKYACVQREEVFREFEIKDQNSHLEEKGRICSVKEFRDRVRSGQLIRTNKEKFGIPQGSPISAVLSNIFLLEFDSLMSRTAVSLNGLYKRYCDDIFWITPKSCATNIQEFVAKTIDEDFNLLINSEKTEISEFFVDANGQCIGIPTVQYLGFTFDGEKRLLRSQTLARYHRKMRAGVRAAGAAAYQTGNSKIYKKTLYERYSHLGKRNFISYAIKASKIMGSKSIRSQIRNHWKKLNQEISNTESYLQNLNKDE